MLTANHKSFGPITKTHTGFIDALHYYSFVINDQSGTIGEDSDMRWGTKVMMAD